MGFVKRSAFETRFFLRIPSTRLTRADDHEGLYPSYKESNHCIARRSKYFLSCHANISRSLTTAIDVDSCRHGSTEIQG
jgi:hypothetical protein